MLGRMVAWFRMRREQTLEVKSLLEGAERLARDEGLERPGGEHLLQAACDLPDGTATAALGVVGLTPDDLAAALRRAHDDALGRVGLRVDDGAVEEALPPHREPRGVFHAQGSLQALLRRTYDLVQQADARFAGAWVVVAASEARQGTVSRALDRLAVDRDDLAAAARRAAIDRDARRLT